MEKDIDISTLINYIVLNLIAGINMKIGIYSPDTKEFPNYALMKISAYHKAQGDVVEWYEPLWHKTFDKVYCSSAFDFTSKEYVTDDMIVGGTGFDKDIELPPEIDACEPDYSIYPWCDYSIIWFDIGCFRNCPFCVNDNNHRAANRLTLNPNGKYIRVQDDTFFYGDWKRKIDWLLKVGQKVDMQNVDARIFTEEMADALLKLKHHKQIKMAWDNPREPLEKKFKEISTWIPSYKIMVYVLIGYWSTPEEDLYRVTTLANMGYDPFVMPFDKSNPYQKKFARWVNHKAIFKTVEWENYK